MRVVQMTNGRFGVQFNDGRWAKHHDADGFLVHSWPSRGEAVAFIFERMKTLDKLYEAIHQVLLP